MRHKEITGTDPPEGEETPALAANRGFGKLENPGEAYSAAELPATGNHLGPGTATIELTQGRFAFVDSSEADLRIETYLKFIARELSDDQLPSFFHARFAYQKFQRLGTPECRRYAWHAIELACRLSAKEAV